MSTVASQYTPEGLLAMPDGKNFELVNGHLLELNVSSLSSWVAGRLHHLVSSFLDEQPIGWVWPGSTGYQCFPDDPARVRRPDMSFIRRGRLAGERFPAGYLRMAPDLAVEVVSPNDLVYELEEKLSEYRAAGVRLVWVIDPERKTVRVQRADGTTDWLTEADHLDGESVIPGFRCAVRDLFPAAGD